MKRREALIAATGACLTLSGCLTRSSQTPSIGEIYTEETDLTVEIQNPQYAESVTFNPEREDTETVSISEEEATASYSLGDIETIGTEDQRLWNNTEIRIEVQNQSGESVNGEDWLYSPEIELADIHHASEFNYEPQNHAAEATPILEISNTGTGPTRLQEIAVLNIDQDIPLADTREDTSFAHAVIATHSNDDRVSPVETHNEEDFLITGEESAYFALDGFFTHSGDEPEPTDTATQTFDIEVRWLFEQPRYSVTTTLKNGLTQSEGQEQYRFQDYSIDNIDLASPLE